jgi:hypothetical protein
VILHLDEAPDDVTQAIMDALSDLNKDFFESWKNLVRYFPVESSFPVFPAFSSASSIAA